MQYYELQHLDRLKIDDTYFGGDQDWYAQKKHQDSGCGPTTAANQILYLTAGQPTKTNLLALMDEMMTNMPPTVLGNNTTHLFLEGVVRYETQHQLGLECESLDIPIVKGKRPPIEQSINFIKDALSQERPVAFLNLSAGSIKNLENWHWVLITSMTLEGEDAQIEIYDQGERKELSFSTWFATTRLGGGLVWMGLKQEDKL